MSLAEFLLARIGEDASYAEHAKWAMQGEWFATADDKVDEFVRHMSPTRVLAECEAKRRIVVKYRETLAAQEAKTDEHTRASSRIDRHGELPLLRRDGWVYEGRLWGLKVALTFLALPYADHPDYRQEWRP